MPCVAKKQESDYPIFSFHGIRDVDLVITTKELGAMLKLHGIDPRRLKPVPFDSPFQKPTSKEPPSSSGLGTGAGQLVGATGGVMEASLRSVYEMVMGTKLPRVEFEAVRGFESLKEASVSLYDKETGRGIDIDLKVVHGLATAKKLIHQLQQREVSYDYVEVMACPGGCFGGGGQPRCADKETREHRLQSIL